MQIAQHQLDLDAAAIGFGNDAGRRRTVAAAKIEHAHTGAQVERLRQHAQIVFLHTVDAAEIHVSSLVAVGHEVDPKLHPRLARGAGKFGR